MSHARGGGGRESEQPYPLAEKQIRQAKPALLNLSFSRAGLLVLLGVFS